MKDSISKEVTFNHPIDTIWKAITQAEEISTWFIQADFKAEPGYQYTFVASEENNCTNITGEVKAANPYTLVYTWIVENTDVETTVTWQLETTENGTLLRLEHSGISNYSGDTALTMFTSYSNGWDKCMVALEEHAQKMVHAG
ncbi:SRPBCC domain-containing protein [Aureisphaera galaxeae]|uniref:SRPBCC family protein n=1 Tax=Aureisphaera galaxeae TaxID=1538023 RepID=UPI0023501148|nr:SRPBCC domain-containing protein [Aureisphaera galaxeae]MDC8004354.1 SRPBCC domain-containing protein [Aureisphaera galaxeae]